MTRQSEAKQLKALGNRISTVRRERGVTQEQLAEKTGFTSITIGYIEQGRRSPRICDTIQDRRMSKSTRSRIVQGPVDLSKSLLK